MSSALHFSSVASLSQMTGMLEQTMGMLGTAYAQLEAWARHQLAGGLLDSSAWRRVGSAGVKWIQRDRERHARPREMLFFCSFSAPVRRAFDSENLGPKLIVEELAQP